MKQRKCLLKQGGPISIIMLNAETAPFYFFYKRPRLMVRPGAVIGGSDDRDHCIDRNKRIRLRVLIHKSYNSSSCVHRRHFPPLIDSLLVNYEQSEKGKAEAGMGAKAATTAQVRHTCRRSHTPLSSSVPRCHLHQLLTHNLYESSALHRLQVSLHRSPAFKKAYRFSLTSRHRKAACSDSTKRPVRLSCTP